MALNSYLKRPHCTKITLPDPSEVGDENYKQKVKVGGQSSSEINFSLVGKQINAVEVDFKTVSGKRGEFDKFLDGIENEGFNAVIVCLKGPDGKLCYDSQVEQAIEWQTVSKKADVDLAEVVDRVERRGLIPIARIVAFFDQTAPGADRQNTFLDYYDSSSGDRNSSRSTSERSDFKVHMFKRNGAGFAGGMWLDASKPVVRKYVADLACEAVNFGFKYVVFDYAFFPPVSEKREKDIYSQEGGLNGKVKADCILKFVRELENRRVVSILSYPVRAIFDYDGALNKNDDFGNNLFGDVDFVIGSFKNHAPIFEVSSFESDFKKYEDFLSGLKFKVFVAPEVDKSILLKKNKGKFYDEIENSEVFDSKFVTINHRA